MSYKFYRNSDKKVTPTNPDYSWIKDQFDMYDLLDKYGWKVETCAPRLRNEWSETNKTCGQCSITSFLVQDIFGGEVYGVATKAGTHCFNVIDDVVFDLTSEQFSGEDTIKVYPLDKPQTREEHFASEEKYERYKLLKKNIENYK